jgi:Bifunctional DNA primase/polymerase, N-terminal
MPRSNSTVGIAPSKAGKRGQRTYPFREGAPVYRARGWPGTIPVSRNGTKRPLAPGITGHEGTDADDGYLAELVRKYGWANLGLRLALDIIGIDVDAYDGKCGGRTLRSLSGRLGPLPVTWRSTSRAPEDPVSGIYLFRAPRKPGWTWTGDLGVGSGIEIIQRHHRFATVWPSLHNSTGRPYRWWRGTGEAAIPGPEDLPLLPVKWARYLLSSREFRPGRKAAAPAEIAGWYGRVSGGPMCEWMERSAQTEAAKMRNAVRTSGTHTVLIAAATHICQNAAEGHTGLERALSLVHTEFAAARSRIKSRNVSSDWSGAVNTAMAHAAGGKQETDDPCGLRLARPVRRTA